MKSIVYLGFSAVFLVSCGNKVVNNTNNPLKDTIQTDMDSVKEPKQNNIVDIEPKEVDSADIITNTEVLDEKGQLDPNSSPIAVVQTIIKAAKTGNYTPLLKLSNPAINMDGDAKDIINVPNKSKEDQKEFNDYFGNAKIVGKCRIKKNLAEVDIETTAEGGDKETIILENKYEKWYLKGL